MTPPSRSRSCFFFLDLYIYIYVDNICAYLRLFFTCIHMIFFLDEDISMRPLFFPLSIRVGVRRDDVGQAEALSYCIRRYADMQ